MGLNFDRIKHRIEHGTGHQWTSYSDLFLVLSVTFLLLYMVANLRSGATAALTSGQVAEQEAKIRELEKQLKAYEVLKDDYVENGASKEEVEMYRELEDRLGLLEKEAREDYAKANQEAKDAKLRFNGLNKYQSLIKNVINANMVSSSKQKRQQLVIADREASIDEKSAAIEKLETDVADKNNLIERNQDEIERIRDDVERKKLALKSERAVSSKERARLTAEFESLKSASDMKIKDLEAESQRASSELVQTQAALDDTTRKAERVVAELEQKSSEFQNKIAAERVEYDRRVNAERGKYEGLLSSTRLTAEQKAKEGKALQDRLAQSEREYNDKIGGLNTELASTKQKFDQAAKQYGDSMRTLNAATTANEGLKKDLASSMERLNAQRKLAAKIKDNLRKAGVEAEVDGKSGDVTISFGEEYFETGRSELKPAMRELLEKTLPAYSKGLFEDPATAKKISNVEIVGFASPTYQGRVVDPTSLAGEDRKAVNFNMDLSYKRTKSIFDYVFDEKKVRFEHQTNLLPLVKVSGRSYLSADRIPAGQASKTSADEYCQKHNCRKHQIVVIKFNLKEQ